MKNCKMIVIMISLIMILSLFQASVLGAENKELEVMRIGITVEVDSLSPLISYSQIGYEVFMLIYDSLVTFDENLEPVPGLAKKWTVSDDETEWTFVLRDDVKWHDGESFTSSDVKFTYDLLLENELGMYSGYLGGITEVSCPDDYTVVMKTENPKANMLFNACPILPEHIWKDVSSEEYETWPNENPIGTGAFKFVKFKLGEYLQLAANDDYFNGRPKMDELVYVLYANTDTLAQSLKLGEIDAAINFSTSQLKSLQDEKGINAISAVALGFTELSFNSWEDAQSKA
ncbi:MAG: ABC transporter substrate-binding protein, partial [Clostridiales bacterium]|nr:ABC transporter substrate-binding protein [Clostridiales bacterium]